MTPQPHARIGTTTLPPTDSQTLQHMNRCNTHPHTRARTYRRTHKTPTHTFPLASLSLSVGVAKLPRALPPALPPYTGVSIDSSVACACARGPPLPPLPLLRTGEGGMGESVEGSGGGCSLGVRLCGFEWKGGGGDVVSMSVTEEGEQVRVSVWGVSRLRVCVCLCARTPSPSFPSTSNRGRGDGRVRGGFWGRLLFGRAPVWLRVEGTNVVSMSVHSGVRVCM